MNPNDPGRKEDSKSGDVSRHIPKAEASSRHPRFTAAAVGVVVVFCAAALVVQTRDPQTAARLGGEDGPFEYASVAFYGAGFLLTLYGLIRHRSLVRLSGALMLLWAMLRELDFQQRFTYRSIESLGYYTRPIAPWSEKLLVLLGLLPFAWAGCYLFVALLRSIRPAWLHREKWTGYVLAMAFLLGLGSVLEKLLKFSPAEEVCESGASLIVLLLAWELRGNRHSGRDSDARLKVK